MILYYPHLCLDPFYTREIGLIGVFLFTCFVAARLPGKRSGQYQLHFFFFFFQEKYKKRNKLGLTCNLKISSM